MLAGIIVGSIVAIGCAIIAVAMAMAFGAIGNACWRVIYEAFGRLAQYLIH